jgi:soluble lytic murein transglycosylase-like protein
MALRMLVLLAVAGVACFGALASAARGPRLRRCAHPLSQADARGLLQVTPTTAVDRKLNVNGPSSNVLAGARYLRLMLNRFQRTDLALAAYNAGRTLVERLGRAPSQETQTYVANVQQRWAALAGCT